MTTASTIERIHELVANGETDLATIESIRAVDAWWPEPGRDHLRLPALAEVLNVLGVLRHEVGDLRGAVGSFEAALHFVPGHPDATANLREAAPLLEAQEAEVVERPSAAPDALNPWTRTTLEHMQSVVDLAGKEVLEIGGALPRAVAQELGVARWVASELRCAEVIEPGYEVRMADAADLPFEDETFDVAFSSCAFEHFMDVEAVLAEAFRLLRPGGVLYSEHGPLWTHAHGHHLYYPSDAGLLAFDQPIVPNWAHLLLSRSQLRRFLSLGYGEDVAAGADAWIFEGGHANHVPEAAQRKAFWTSGFEVVALERGGWIIEPPPALRAELEALHPDGSDFAAYTYRVVLRKPHDLATGAPAGLGAATAGTVSVVVPAVPGTHFADAVMSALTQTRPVDEVVVVATRGDGDVADVMAHLAGTDRRIRLEVGAGHLATLVLDVLTRSRTTFVMALDPSDVLLPRCIERLAAPLDADPDLVASEGGEVPLDGAGIPMAGGTGLLPVPTSAVVDGSLVAGAHLTGAFGGRGMGGALVRASALSAAAAVAPDASSELVLDAAWLRVLARGPVAALAEVVAGRGRPVAAPVDAVDNAELARMARSSCLLDAVQDEAVTRQLLAGVLSLSELRPVHLPVLADLAARLPRLQARVAEGPPARSVALVLPARADVHEIWALLEGALSSTYVNLVDLVLVDRSGGVLARDLAEVADALAASFQGSVSVARDDEDLATVANPFVAFVEDPARLRWGWLPRLVGQLRTGGAPRASEPGATVVRTLRGGADPVAGAPGAASCRVEIRSSGTARSPVVQAPAPLVLVGPFRSGSTFLSNLLRQDPSSTVYLEPLHPQLLELVDAPPQHPGRYGHVGVDGHFDEFRQLARAQLGQLWKPWFGREHWVLDADDRAPELEAYLHWLIGATGKRAVLKEVRADLRTGWLRHHLPDATIVQLWRDPRQIWRSIIERSPGHHQGFLAANEEMMAAAGLPAMAHDYEQFYAWSLISTAAIGRHADAVWDHAVALADFPRWSQEHLVDPGLLPEVPLAVVQAGPSTEAGDCTWFAEVEEQVATRLLERPPALLRADSTLLAAVEDLVAGGGRPRARALPAVPGSRR